LSLDDRPRDHEPGQLAADLDDDAAKTPIIEEQIRAFAEHDGRDAVLLRVLQYPGNLLPGGRLDEIRRTTDPPGAVLPQRLMLQGRHPLFPQEYPQRGLYAHLTHGSARHLHHSIHLHGYIFKTHPI
jgi:hypothetical protein